MSWRRVTVLAGVAVLALVTTAGCGTEAGDHTSEKPDSRVVEKDEGHIVIELSDKRQVSLEYAEGKGLVEQHNSSDGGDWSARRTIHRTTADACQEVDAKAHGSTVTVTADWGDFCSDGEPPTESVAMVGADDLAKWDTEVTENSDGWPPAKFYDGGDRVRFVMNYGEGTATLTWNS